MAPFSIALSESAMAAIEPQAIDQEVVLRVRDLNSRLKALVSGFTPPNEAQIEDALDVLRAATSDGGEQLALIILNICEEWCKENAVDGRLAAVIAVLRSWWGSDEQAQSWIFALNVVESHWPTWGLPWYRAAYDEENLDRRSEYLLIAHRLLPIADTMLVRALDHYRKQAQKDRQRDHELLAAELLCTHKPTIINFSRYLDLAYTLSRRQRAPKIVDQCLAIHGSEPADWLIGDRFDELTSAGALCTKVNAVAAAKRKPWNYKKWNHAAIDFLLRGLKAWDARSDPDARSSRFTLLRLGETYASLLRYPQYLSDEERREALENGVRVVTNLGRLDSRSAYQASRQLAAMVVGEARHARSEGRPSEEIERLVDRAHELYRNLRQWAFAAKRERIAEWHAEFLFEFGRYEQAREVAAGTEREDLAKVASLYQQGKTREALRAALDALAQRGADAGRHPEVIGFNLLLVHYMEESERRGAKVPQKLRADVLAELRRHLPQMVTACGKAIQAGDIYGARRRLRAACYAEGRSSANLIHLQARIDLAAVETGYSPDTALEGLLAAITEQPDLLDDHLRDAMLQLLARGAGRDWNDDSVWRLAQTTNPRLPRFRYSLVSALRWQIETRNLRSFAARLIDAVRLFPDETIFTSMPARLWLAVGEEALPYLEDLFDRCTGNPALVSWLAAAFSRMPDDFARGATVSAIARVLNAVFGGAEGVAGNLPARQLGQRVASLFTRSQIALWGDRESCVANIESAAELITMLPGHFQTALWAQWFGSERAAFERHVIGRLIAEVERLEGSLLRSGEDDVRLWVEQLNNFLRELRWQEIAAPSLWPAEEAIVEFCRAATERFDPNRRERDYWRELHSLVFEWIQQAGGSVCVERAQILWLATHTAIERSITGRVGDVCWLPIHSFKNSLLDVGFVNERTGARSERFGQVLRRTKNFLRWHRWPEFEAIDMREILESAAYRPPFASTSRISPRRPQVFAIRPTTEVPMRADAELLIEATVALLENALRSVAALGTAGAVWAEVRDEGSRAVIEIRDNGKGGEAATLQRLNGSSERRFSGTGSTGYGVRLSHRIARLHGGTLSFFSTGRNRGMKVVLTLPRG